MDKVAALKSKSVKKTSKKKLAKMATSDSETNGNNAKERRMTNGITTTSSAEDLSEYTDADESISAPTEILAEFLSSVMLKDYETALKYCKIILQYEPHNATAREFYPLIVEKLQMIEAERDYSEGEDGDSSSSISDDNSSSSSSSRSCSSSSEGDLKPSDSDATTASYSSLEDDEADQENNAIGFTSTEYNISDIANGNTRKPKVHPRTHPAQRNKTETQSVPNLRPTKQLLETRKKITEEMKKKLKIVNKTPESTKDKSPKHVFSPKRKQEKVISPEIFKTAQFKISKEDHINSRQEHSPESPESDSGLGFTTTGLSISSDSESPTDPTIQELRVRVTQGVSNN